MSSVLENFQKHTAEFLDAVALFADRERSLAPEGEWSASYIVHHTSDCELHFATRYLFILGSENPAMAFFDEDRYPEALHYEKRSVAKSLASIVGLRAMVLEILSAISDEAWSRRTTAEDGTQYSLGDLVARADEHLVAHTEQLIALKSQI